MTSPSSPLADSILPVVSEEGVAPPSSSPSCISRSLGRGWSMISYVGSKIGSGVTYILTPITCTTKAITRAVVSIFSSSSPSSESPIPPVLPASETDSAEIDESCAEIEIDVEGDLEFLESQENRGSGVLSTIGAYTIAPLMSVRQSISNVVKSVFSSSTSEKQKSEEEIDDFIEVEIDGPKKEDSISTSLPVEPKPTNSDEENVESSSSSDVESTPVDPLVDAEIQPEPASPELEVDLSTIEPTPSEVAPLLPKIIRIPAKGYCLFAAVLVGLVRQNQNNEELMKKLGVNPLDFQGDDFTSDGAIGMIEGHANRLREEVVNYMIRELNVLEKNPKTLQRLVDADNNITKDNYAFLPSSKNRNVYIRTNKISQMITHLKIAICDYNENVKFKIQHTQDDYETNMLRFFELQETANEIIHSLKEFSFFESKDIADNKKHLQNLENRLKEIQKAMTDINGPITRNLEEVMDWSQKKLACAPTGFSKSEIPALKTYLNRMREPTQYANISEIMALSHLYQVPIQVYYNYDKVNDYSNFHDPNFEKEGLHTQTFNNHLDGEPIRLDFDGQHYNLLLV